MRNNKKNIWMTKTILVGFTQGSPGGWIYFSTTFSDGGAAGKYPDGSEFLGQSHYYSGGWAIPGKGKSWADIKLGNLRSSGLGDQTGFDASADESWGYTFMNDDIPINSWQEDCCYGQD